MNQFVHGSRLKFVLQWGNEPLSYQAYCLHFALLTPPIDIVNFLVELQRINTKLVRTGAKAKVDAIRALSDVRIISPCRGSKPLPLHLTTFRRVMSNTKQIAPALVIGYWPELHSEMETCRLKSKMTGCMWQVDTSEPDWKVTFEIYGPNGDPILLSVKQPLVAVQERLQTDEAMSALAEWATL